MRLLLIAILLPVLVLPGCMSIGVEKMTPEQIRATNGMASCTTLRTMYGAGSSVSLNADDLRKGVTAKGKTTIRCGEAVMEIETDIGVATVPAAKPAR